MIYENIIYLIKKNYIFRKLSLIFKLYFLINGLINKIYNILNNII